MPSSTRCLGFVAASVVAAALAGPWPEWILAADEAAPPATEKQVLIDKLQQSVGSTVNVELKNGTLYVRATLLRVASDRKKGRIRSLIVEEVDTGKSVTLGFATVGKITVDREAIYTAPAGKPRTAAERRAGQSEQRAAEERQEWVERARAHQVEPWPELTRQEHKAAIDRLRKFMDEVGRAMPGMSLHETHEFLFFSNIPADQVAPYTVALDSMHDMMCQMYGIKRGQSVWKGKCLVVAFLNRTEFNRFEQTFMHNDDVGSAYGLCHYGSDGRVIISCYRGDRPEDFANMLVHETSHGFIHRYRTPERPPSWVNEGMADWIARALVPNSRAVTYRERNALQTMQQTRKMGGDFLTREGNIDAWQYGIASSLTDFLLKTDGAAYTRFIQGIKEGLSWQKSLQEAYGTTPQQMIAAYGEAIGVPDLHE